MLLHWSRFLSAALSPMLTPTYGVMLALWVSILCYQSFSTRITVLLWIFAITCILPLLAIRALQIFQVINDSTLRSRKQRIYPYLWTIIAHIFATYYIIKVHAPIWLVMFMGGMLACCVIMFIINYFWKICAHTAGIGCLVALLFFMHQAKLAAFNSIWLICFTIILAGVIGSSQIYQGRNTLSQVFAGFAVGFACTHFAINLFY
jgi:membrane-associated phospholipid phosphatase